MIDTNQGSASRSLKSKIALITGATGGFGRILADKFMQTGANLILLARDGSSLEKMTQQLS